MRKDRLLFAFLLSCQLLVDEGRLDPLHLTALPDLYKLALEPSSGQSHPGLPWLREAKWRFLRGMEDRFKEFKGEEDQKFL